MKFNIDKKYLYWGLTAFLVLVASVSFYYIIFQLPSIFQGISDILTIINPIIYGLAIAYILNPLVCQFEKIIYGICKRYKWTVNSKTSKLIRILVVVFSLFLAFLCIYGLLYMLIPEVFGSILNIIDNFPRYVNNAQKWLEKFFVSDDAMNAATLELLGTASNMLENWLTNDLMPQLNNIIKNLSSSVLGIFTFLKNFLIGAIISIYLLISKENFIAKGKRILFAFFSVDTSNHIIHNLRFIDDKFGGFIIGKVIDSAIIGLLCYIGTSLMNTPYALLISVIVGVTNVIPFFGPFIGAVPSAVLILVVSPIKCLYFIIYVFILQQLDGNFIGPKILSGSTGLSSFMVIVAILIGGGLFGAFGMFVGVPVCSVIVAICQAWLEQRIEKQNIPAQLDLYKNLDSMDPNTKEIYPLKERKSGESRLIYKKEESEIKIKKNKTKAETK